MAKKTSHKGAEINREVLGVLIMAFAVLIFLGLISYKPSDYPNSGSPESIRNWLGLAGACISHFLYVYTIGYSGILFPFLLFLLGWNVFLQQPLKSFFRFSLYMLGLGLFLSTALAMPEAVSREGSSYGFTLSGLLGGFLAEQLNHYVGTAGSVVVLLTCLLVFLISATSWSMRSALLGFKEQAERLVSALKRRKRVITGRTREKSDTPPRRQAPIIEMEKEAPPRKAPQPQRAPVREPVPRQEKPASAAQAAPPSPPAGKGAYRYPPLELLAPAPEEEIGYNRKELEEQAAFLEDRLKEFDIRGHVVGVRPGPVITRFEVRPAPGVKISRFVSLQDDIALVMQARRVRVVAPIPGKAAVGIEIPNKKASLVTLRGVLESPRFQKSESKLTLALGQTIEGKPYLADLKDMPHLLVAGATGAGKSVCLNSIITSILYRARPEEVKLLLIDPKKLELSVYRRLRRHHLTTQEGLDEDVITTVDNAVAVLRSLEKEMERRYRILAGVGVRNLEDYHRLRIQKRAAGVEPENLPEPLPYVVLIVDELADLMMTGAREVEEPIARLAQMSRAVGVHLILATQRPSVDVITGVIKANFPSRIAFQVAAKTDSRTILDRNGAEKLLGRGDMLFLPPREAEPIRIHGAFVSTEEVKRVVAHIASQPESAEWRLKSAGGGSSRSGIESGPGDRDELFREAAKLVIRHQQGSASLLQRRLRVGYARAGRLIDELEEAGILGPFEGSKAREVLVEEDFLERLDQKEDEEKENELDQ